MGGTSQGGVFTAVRSTTPAAGPAGARGEQQAELWGDAAVEGRSPRPSQSESRRSIAVNTSRVFAFSDGLSSGELEGMREALGPTWRTRFKSAEALPLDLIATRLPAEQ